MQGTCAITVPSGPCAATSPLQVESRDAAREKAFESMLGGDNRGSDVFIHAVERADEVIGRSGVECPSRLICDQHGRCHRERGGKRNTLTFPTGTLRQSATPQTP